MMNSSPAGQFFRAYKESEGFSQFAFLTGWLMARVLPGKNIRNGQRASFPLSSIARRCSAEWKGNRYSNQKLQNDWVGNRVFR